MHQIDFVFKNNSIEGGWRVDERSWILLFPICSHQVPNGFAICSPNSQGVCQHIPNNTSFCFNVVLLERIFGTYVSMCEVNV